MCLRVCNSSMARDQLTTCRQRGLAVPRLHKGRASARMCGRTAGCTLVSVRTSTFRWSSSSRSWLRATRSSNARIPSRPTDQGRCRDDPHPLPQSQKGGHCGRRGSLLSEESPDACLEGPSRSASHCIAPRRPPAKSCRRPRPLALPVDQIGEDVLPELGALDTRHAAR